MLIITQDEHEYNAYNINNVNAIRADIDAHTISISMGAGPITIGRYASEAATKSAFNSLMEGVENNFNTYMM